MEGILDVYHSDYDTDCPVVCFDESSKQLVTLAMYQNLCCQQDLERYRSCRIPIENLEFLALSCHLGQNRTMNGPEGSFPARFIAIDRAHN